MQTTSGRRPRREIEHALTITTRNIYALMDEARKHKAIQQRARTRHRIQEEQYAIDRYVRIARDKSRHALALRRMLARYEEQ